MLASPLAQFGLRGGETLVVPIVFGQEEIRFGVRLYRCEAADGRSLLHAEIFHPDNPALFWLRVIVHYQMAVERAAARGRIPPGEERSIRRTQLLAHVGVAFPQRSSALECRTISLRTARATKQDEEDSVEPQTWVEPEAAHTGREPEVTDDTLERLAAAYLMGAERLGRERIQAYLEFERPLLERMEGLLKEHAGPGKWRQAHAEMAAVLTRVRKKADNERREELLLLQSACDASLMHMYQYAAGAVLRSEALLKALDPLSLTYNHKMHAVQDRLGGIVPAIHPLWPICLGSPRDVGILLDYSARPDAEPLINRVNQVFVEAVRNYVDVVQRVEQGTRSLDAPVGTAKRTRHEVVPDTAQQAAEDRWEVMEALRFALRGLAGDRDVEAALATVCDELDVKTLAMRFSCSPGQVSKMKSAGLKKIRKALKELGLSGEDVLRPFAARPVAQQQPEYRYRSPDDADAHRPPDSPRPGSSFG